MVPINILFIGDIVGKPGMDMVKTWLPMLEKKYKADFIIANAENAADGKGCTDKEGKELFGLGISVLTGGNHTWDKPQSQEYLRAEERYLRPQNYPKGTYGKGIYVSNSKRGKIAVLNLQGRAFMATIDCPFRSADWILEKIKSETKVVIVDFHAEASAEKIALAHYLDGKVSAIIGTHTHIQTCDDRILEKGTAFITDVGMTGPYDSVIGMKKDAAINRFLYQTPQKYQTAENEIHLCGLFLRVDPETGKTVEIERILLPEFTRKSI